VQRVCRACAIEASRRYRQRQKSVYDRSVRIVQPLK
jgi:hypothetical protein